MVEPEPVRTGSGQKVPAPAGSATLPAGEEDRDQHGANLQDCDRSGYGEQWTVVWEGRQQENNHKQHSEAQFGARKVPLWV